MTEYNNTPTLTREQLMMIPELAKKHTGKEIAAYFNISYHNLHKWIKRLRKSGIKVVFGVTKGTKPTI